MLLFSEQMRAGRMPWRSWPSQETMTEEGTLQSSPFLCYLLHSTAQRHGLLIGIHGSSAGFCSPFRNDYI